MSLNEALAGQYSFYKDPDVVLSHYHEFGFHIEKNFFDAAYCDLLVQEANQLAQARLNNFKPVLMPHKENQLFLDAMKSKKSVEILKKLMDGNPVGMQTQFFYHKPGTRGFSMHQDNFYIQAKSGVFISIWVALVDVNDKNGGLIVYPFSHKEGDLPVRKLNLELDPQQDRNANNEETIVPPQYKPVNVTLSKGSALFIHAHLVHGSHKNDSDDYRYSLLNLYIKEGEAFRSGHSAKREAIGLN